MKPKDIKEHLDKYIVKQDDAKIALSIALYNHKLKINNPNLLLPKSNLLLKGETGTGKTYMCTKLASIYQNIPFLIVNASEYTKTGWSGKDFTEVIEDLYNASGKNIELTEQGIIVLDEVDKLIGKGSGEYSEVDGHGRQQSLLTILEGSDVKITDEWGVSVNINTSNILFIGIGAFKGLREIQETRSKKRRVGFAIKSETLDTESGITTEDLVQYGYMPEFIGRFQEIVELEDLTKADLRNILLNTEDNELDRYINYFEVAGKKVNVHKMINKIVDKALKSKTGARGLRKALNDHFRKDMFNVKKGVM
jgi:ATP-dependent Clp protease ATP-binding subunit ClpX